MGNFVEKVKSGFWNLINSPGSESVDDGHDEEYYEDEREEERYSRSDRDDYYEEYEAPPAQPRWSEKRTTSARQAKNNKVLEMHGKTAAVKAEVVIRRPVNVEEASKVCDLLRSEKICVVDLTGMERSMTQRIADFLSGACYALDGSVQRVSRDIFVIVAEGVRVTADVQEELERDGYVFPSRAARR